MSRGTSSDPFDEPLIRSLLRVRTGTRRVISRESKRLEFKKSFHRGRTWDAYAKTFAAFANAAGGYMVFGVKDRPREAVGLRDNRFASLDSKDLAQHLNQRFAPEIQFHVQEYELAGVALGLIFVEPCSDKPVVALSNGDGIQEGGIYYRYGARSDAIRYAELRAILDERREREQALWMRHLRRLARVGVENAAIFDPASGEVQGRGGTFVIDRELLPRLRFVREGDFQQRSGAPTLKLVGNVEVLAAATATTRRVRQAQAILADDVLRAFLRRDADGVPDEYLKVACAQQSVYQPIYFLLSETGWSRRDGQAFLSSLPRGDRFVERILTTDAIRLPFTVPRTDSYSARRTRELRRQLIGDEDIDVPRRDVPYLLRAIRTIEADRIELPNLLAGLSTVHELFNQLNDNEKADFRKACCYVDRAAFLNPWWSRPPL